MTNDVEEHSIQKNKLDDDTAKIVFEVGLPMLLNLYEKHKINTTFFFTGTFVEKFPDSVKIVKEKGHEVGCHGYSHEVNRGLDNLPYKQQLCDIEKAKHIIEKEAGKIVSFRAPALRINADTIKVLEKLGFKIDSSIASQRFDGPFSFGSIKKLNWLFANRKPYFINSKNPFKKGKTNILEIPISAFGIAHIGTIMRIMPKISHILSKLLFIESKITNKPIVFDIHPNECIWEEGNFSIEKRSKNFLSYFFADFLRTKMKVKNLGNNALKLLEKEIIYAKRSSFRFITCKEYREIYENIHNNNG